MTAFLFLQKFENGIPVAMPFKTLVDILCRFGAPGHGRGDLEITLPPDLIAVGCTIIGDLQSGVTCVGFERPRFDAELRRVAWECMETFGCAVFDDALETLCTTLEGIPALPDNLVAACAYGIREISSAQQLWPDQFMTAVDAPPRPVLRYTNPNTNGPNFQFFDYAEFDKNYLYIELNIRPEACNPGTLRVLRNLELRVDAALTINSEFSVLYKYSNPDSPLCMLESPRIKELATRATIISPPPKELEEPTPKNLFSADRGVFTAELNQAIRTTQYAHQNHNIALDGAIETVERLAGLLDKFHSDYCQERDTHTSNEPFTSANATDWAMMAGGYLGTIIRQQLGAQWGYVTSGLYRLPVVRTHRGRICNTHLLALDHIINGPRSSIADYFNKLIKTDTSATPRHEDLVCNIPGFCHILLGQSTFTSGGGLPLENKIPRDKLDFSVNSLRQLDLYLTLVAHQASAFSDQSLSNLVLAAGAYVGEVIRSNAKPTEFWRWVNYDDYVCEQPEFAKSRPREFGFFAILDSAQQMTYPIAHVAALLSGVQFASTYDYAKQLVGDDNDSKKGDKDHREPETNKKTASRPVSKPLSKKEFQRTEQVTNGIAALFSLIPRMLTCIVLIYAIKATLAEFRPISGSLPPLKSLLYTFWIASPGVLLGLRALVIKRNFLRDAALLFASMMLAFFGMSAFALNSPASAGLRDASAFIWVPLVQMIWVGGWILLLKRTD